MASRALQAQTWTNNAADSITLPEQLRRELVKAHLEDLREIDHRAGRVPVSNPQCIHAIYNPAFRPAEWYENVVTDTMISGYNAVVSAFSDMFIDKPVEYPTFPFLNDSKAVQGYETTAEIKAYSGVEKRQAKDAVVEQEATAVEGFPSDVRENQAYTPLHEAATTGKGFESEVPLNANVRDYLDGPMIPVANFENVFTPQYRKSIGGRPVRMQRLLPKIERRNDAVSKEDTEAGA